MKKKRIKKGKQVRPLSRREVEQLVYYHKNDEKGYFRERCHILLLSNDGYTTREINEELSLDPHTIYKWIDRYEAMGLGGLENKIGQGRNSSLESILSPKQMKILLREVKKDPDNINKVRKRLNEIFEMKLSTRVFRRYVETLKKNEELL